MSKFYKKMGMDKRQRKQFQKNQEKKIAAIQNKQEVEQNQFEAMARDHIDKLKEMDGMKFAEQIAGEFIEELQPWQKEFIQKIMNSRKPITVCMPKGHGNIDFGHGEGMTVKILGVGHDIIIFDEIDAETLAKLQEQAEAKIEKLMNEAYKKIAVPPGFLKGIAGSIHACSFGTMAGNDPQQMQRPWDYWAEIKPMPDGSGKAACSVCGNRFDIAREEMQIRGGRGTCENCGHACSILNDYKRKA